MVYFVEVTKMSGIKTYFGPKVVELYTDKYNLNKDDGFTDMQIAETYVDTVINDCKSKGMAIAKAEVISI